MDPPPQASTLPAQISGDASAGASILDPAPSAAEASKTVGETLPSAAPIDEVPMTAPPQTSAETADANVDGSIATASAPAEAVHAQAAVAASEQDSAPAAEQTAGDSVDETNASGATQNETAAAVDSTPAEQNVPAVSSAIDDVGLIGMGDSPTAVADTKTMNAASTSTTEPIEANKPADAPQESTPAATSITTEQPPSVEPDILASSAPESGPTTAAPAVSPSSEAVPGASGPELDFAQHERVADASASEQAQAAQVVTSPYEVASGSAAADVETTAPATEATSTASNTTAVEPVTQASATDASAQPVVADVASQPQADEATAATAHNVSGSTTTEEKAGDSGPTGSATEKPKEAEARVDEQPTAATSSSSEVAAAPAVETIAPSDTAPVSVPATPEKKASTDATSAAEASASQPSTPAREGRVALILRINKELIRFCVDLQAKELTTDQVYREAAVRLQTNLAYLASVADKAGKSVDPGARAAPSGALPRLEPFPRSEHAPSSPLPALYDKLIAIFGAARQADSPVADGKKRSRDSTADASGESPQKRTANKGVERSQDVSAAGTPSSFTGQQPTVGATASTQPADATSTPGPAQPQQPAPAPQAASQQPQQPGQGPDLSLAPPVPIAPPTAAQNIPNNPQAQALMQAFGPNALVNLHALQSHLRGQGTHPWVAYMEANVNGFKAMPLQVQLQHMTALQNAALQRQKAMQGGGDQGAAAGSPATMQNGGMGATSSPAGTRPGSRHSNSPGQAQASPTAAQFGGNAPGRTGTPLGGPAALQKRPGSSGSVGSAGRNRTGSSNLAFDPSQLQSAPSPATMASVTDFTAQQPNFGFQPPDLQQGSPAAAGSPGQQPPQPQPGMMGMPNFQSLPPHLQQQIRQQYMAHMQAQAAQGQQPGFSPQQQQQGQGQNWNFQPPQ